MKLEAFLLILFSFIVLVSCGLKSDSEDPNWDFSYSLDTVQIDPGDKLLFVAYGIRKARLSPDERFLYYYNNIDHAIEKIDLVDESYHSTLFLNEEGKKGVPSREAMDYIVKENGNLFFFTVRNFVELDFEGNLVNESARIDSLFQIPAGKEFNGMSILSPYGNYLEGITSNWQDDLTLGFLDLARFRYHEEKLSQMAYLNDLKVQLDDGIIMGRPMFLAYFDEKITVSHPDGIDVYQLDPKSKEINFYDNRPNKIEQRKPGNYPKSATFEEVYDLVNKEVSYGELFWDKKNRRYYRFASKRPEGKNITKILLIFDDELNLIHEEDFSDLDFRIWNPLVRDGKLYLLQNESDEMEFLVFDFELEQTKP